MMTHISRCADALINQNDPLRHFQAHLNGRLGKPSGHDGWHLWNGLCPFHVDKRPGSFYVNTNTGAFKCHSCGAKGGSLAAFERLLSGGR